MSDFNPFDFMKNRSKSIAPTENDFDDFDYFMCMLALSMRRDQPIKKTGELYGKYLDVTTIIGEINTIPFSRLSKKQQCMAFTSLDGYNLYGKWAKPKKLAPGQNKHMDLIDKIVKVLDCSMNDAEYYIARGLIDEKELNNTYAILYDPNSLIQEIESSAKTKKPKVKKEKKVKK